MIRRGGGNGSVLEQNPVWGNPLGYLQASGAKGKKEMVSDETLEKESSSRPTGVRGEGRENPALRFSRYCILTCGLPMPIQEGIRVLNVVRAWACPTFSDVRVLRVGQSLSLLVAALFFLRKKLLRGLQGEKKRFGRPRVFATYVFGRA